MVQVLQPHCSLSAQKERSCEIMAMRFLPYPGINPSSHCCGKPQAQEQLLQNIFLGSNFSGELFLLSSISWHGDSAVSCCGGC